MPPVDCTVSGLFACITSLVATGYETFLTQIRNRIVCAEDDVQEVLAQACDSMEDITRSKSCDVLFFVGTINGTKKKHIKKPSISIKKKEMPEVPEVNKSPYSLFESGRTLLPCFTWVGWTTKTSALYLGQHRPPAPLWWSPGQHGTQQGRRWCTADGTGNETGHCSAEPLFGAFFEDQRGNSVFRFLMSSCQNSDELGCGFPVSYLYKFLVPSSIAAPCAHFRWRKSNSQYNSKFGNPNQVTSHHFPFWVLFWWLSGWYFHSFNISDRHRGELEVNGHGRPFGSSPPADGGKPGSAPELFARPTFACPCHLGRTLASRASHCSWVWATFPAVIGFAWQRSRHLSGLEAFKKL